MTPHLALALAPEQQALALPWLPLPEQQNMTAPPAPAPEDVVDEPTDVDPDADGDDDVVVIYRPPSSLADLQALGPPPPSPTGIVPQVAYATDANMDALPPTGRFFMVMLADRAPSCDGRMLNSPTMGPMPQPLANSHWSDEAAAVVGRLEVSWWATSAKLGKTLLVVNGVFDLTDTKPNGGLEYAKAAWQGSLRQSSVELGTMTTLWSLWGSLSWDAPWPGEAGYEGIDGWEDAEAVYTGEIRACAITRGPAMTAAMIGLDPSAIPADYAGSWTTVPLDDPQVDYAAATATVPAPPVAPIDPTTQITASAGRGVAVPILRPRPPAVTTPLQAITAAGGPGSLLQAYAAPLQPPAAWFEPLDPALGLMPLHADHEGRVMGYIAPAKDPVTGRDLTHLTSGRGVPLGGHYDRFHDGPFVVRRDDGKLETIAVGTAVYGGPHADLTHNDWHRARDVYSETSAVWAFIRCGENEHGIYAVGALYPKVDRADLPLIFACSPSGDWRADPQTGELTLCGVLQVPTPGFGQRGVAMPSADRMALAADGRPGALILVARIPAPVVASSSPREDARRQLVRAGALADLRRQLGK